MNIAERIDMASALGLNPLPIQIRPDVTVVIVPMPHDLTQAEARRIADIVLAYATPEEPE